MRFLQGTNLHATQHATTQGNTAVLATDEDRIATREHLDFDALMEADAPEVLGQFTVVIQRNHPITHPAGAVLQTECRLPIHKFLYLRLSLKDGLRQSIIPGEGPVAVRGRGPLVPRTLPRNGLRQRKLRGEGVDPAFEPLEFLRIP